MMNKTLRQRAVLEALKHGSIASQEHLQRALRKRGFKVGQATLSRDIRDLNLSKTSHGYSLPQGESGAGIALPPGEFGIPAPDPTRPAQARHGKGRVVTEEGQQAHDASRPTVGYGRAVTAGGIVFLSSMGPIDPATGRVVGDSIKAQTTQCLRNVKARLEEEGSSLEKVVWANWSLRDPAEFDVFNEEWARWFPGDTPVGQGTLMPALQRRAGFRVSIGVIAAA